MIPLAKPDTGDEGMNVQVGCASDLDVITNVASLSKGIGFTPVDRKTCWLLWGFLDDTTRAGILETMPIKFKRTVSQHIEHSVNPYDTTWDYLRLQINGLPRHRWGLWLS